MFVISLIYTAENFLFYHYKNLDIHEIDQITLVDTQALITLKGMSKNTTVHALPLPPPQKRRFSRQLDGFIRSDGVVPPVNRRFAAV